MNKTKIKIPSGGMFQEWCCIMNLVEDKTAKYLENMAHEKGWKEISAEEANEMGFEEIVEWSVPETDSLILVGDKFLVCLHKNFLKNA